jgi:DNA-binding IclR family transcriptional regulator
LSTIDRALAILRLFATDQAEWTVEAAARELQLSQSTAYEYFKSLVKAGLLSTYKTGRYVVGPGIVELDRQTRLRDPLILAARDRMEALVKLIRPGEVVLLCRLYKSTVMCIDQRTPERTDAPIAYERGRPMPLDRGAASKAILASLPPRALRRFYDQSHPSGTGPTWAEFRAPLRDVRKDGYSITRGELDAGRVGISAPVISDGEVIGSIGFVLSEAGLKPRRAEQLGKLVAGEGALISANLNDNP